MFSRRSFLTRLAGAAAAAVAIGELDPEKLLWVPGAKTIFLPTERPLVHGAEAVQAWSVREQAGLAEIIEQKTGIQNPSRFRVTNSAGTFEFDTNWNILRRNGTLLTSAELSRFSRIAWRI